MTPRLENGVRRLVRLRVSDRSIATEIDDELAFHIAERTDALCAQGVTREDARRRALAEFGDLTASRRELARVDKRRQRAATVTLWTSELIADFRCAVRAVKSQPVIACIVALNLSVGVAATTTVFAAIDSYLIRPLPFRDPDRLIAVWTRLPTRSDALESTPADFADWRRDMRTTDLAAYEPAEFSLNVGDEPQRLSGARVSPRLFAILGVSPALGRVFDDAEEQSERSHVVVLSDALWSMRFDHDSAILGRQLLLDGESFTVVGVMPPTFSFPSHLAELWAPLRIGSTPSRDARALSIVGRLHDGASVVVARNELAGIAKRMARDDPRDRDVTTRLELLSHAYYDDTVRRGMTVVMFAAVLVLLVACANIANLLLARGISRARELAVRAALGASRARLVRQLMVESLCLAAGGGVGGVMLAYAGVRAFAAIAPPNIERGDSIGLNWHVLAFGLSATILAGLLVGVLPALRSTGRAIDAVLRDGDRSSTGGRRNRLAPAVAFGELALAVALLAPAGLLLEAGARMHAMHFGFESHELTALNVMMPTAQFRETSRVLATQNALIQELASVPGVTNAAAVSRLPMTVGQRIAYRRAGDPIPEQGREPTAQFRAISPAYFATMRIPIVAGRAFGEVDDAEGRAAVIVSEAFVRRHWPERRDRHAPLGARVAFTADSGRMWREIVGVVGDTREFGPYQNAPPVIYTPSLQMPSRRMTFVVRTARPVDAAALRAAVRAVDPRIPAYDIQRLDDLIRNYEEPALVLPRMFALFGGVALLLTIAGVYGVFSHSVSRRAREMGVRIALGAQPRDIMRLLLRRAALLVAGGLVAGFVVALLVAHVLSFFLFGLTSYDGAIYGTVALVVMGSALAASYGPVRRATRVDPISTLRAD